MSRDPSRWMGEFGVFSFFLWKVGERGVCGVSSGEGNSKQTRRKEGGGIDTGPTKREREKRGWVESDRDAKEEKLLLVRRIRKKKEQPGERVVDLSLDYLNDRGREGSARQKVVRFVWPQSILGAARALTR